MNITKTNLVKIKHFEIRKNPKLLATTATAFRVVHQILFSSQTEEGWHNIIAFLVIPQKQLERFEIGVPE
jgi:hypothetical protein